MRFLKDYCKIPPRVYEKFRQGVFSLGIVLTLVLPVCSAYPVEPAPIPVAMETPSEYELKAIYLYNFLQFVQWPSKDCPLPEGHAKEIVVIGETELTQVLKSLQEKLHEKDKELNLVFYESFRDGMDLSSCCLLFIAASERKKLAKILKSVEGRHVLTVGDSDDFAGAGVMITLLSTENRIRWAINRKPVAESGLKMSAKLLEIAVAVNE